MPYSDWSVHEVVLDDVVVAARHQNAVALGGHRDVDGRRLDVVVRVDAVAHDHDVALRRELLTALAVRHDPDPVVVERVVGEDEIAARVRARISDAAPLAYRIGDGGPTVAALADVEAGIARPDPEIVVELAHLGVERVDPVVAGAIGGEVRPSIPSDTAPVEAVRYIVPRGHVLDGDTIGLHGDAVRLVVVELAVEDHLVAVGAAQHDVLVPGQHLHALVVHARTDEHERARRGRVDGGLDRGELLGTRSVPCRIGTLPGAT